MLPIALCPNAFAPAGSDALVELQLSSQLLHVQAKHSGGHHLGN